MLVSDFMLYRSDSQGMWWRLTYLGSYGKQFVKFLSVAYHEEDKDCRYVIDGDPVWD